VLKNIDPRFKSDKKNNLAGNVFVFWLIYDLAGLFFCLNVARDITVENFATGTKASELFVQAGVLLCLL
jgi:hypothetical protein